MKNNDLQMCLILGLEFLLIAVGVNAEFQLRRQAICILAIMLKKKLCHEYQDQTVQGSQNIDRETIKHRLTHKGGFPAEQHGVVSKKCYRVSFHQK